MLWRPSVCENESNAPQLRRFSLGARASSMRAAIAMVAGLCIASNSCAGQSRGAHCLVLSWSDSVSQENQPLAGAVDSVRLDPDSEVIQGIRRYIARPMLAASAHGPRWNGVTWATWIARAGTDSIEIATNANEYAWVIELVQRGDSVYGEATRQVGDGIEGPYSVRGRRAACPRGRGA